ncbi:copper ion binding protein [Aciduricibacillus chroicocephali]|uniref:Copper ion binding protein n=1 Tax=Aciduricibacillus chroicocephali TaxID=3054939 RepID=A0ABY9KU73_9BACI|nr:copper ion binding protein [Bacillaceae bacterium 44XB]
MEQTISVEGMTCDHCEKSVKDALQELPGVNNVEVTSNPGKAVVDFDNAKVTLADLEKAIAEAGYTPMIDTNM